MEEIRAELRDTMGGRHHTMIDEEEEEEGDEDVYMYPVKPRKNQKFSLER